MKVRTVMSEPVISIGPGDTILEAADLMRDHQIGIVPVLDQGRPVGIVTDRDIVIRAVADRDGIRQRLVGDVMSSEPVSCHVDQSVPQAVAIMGDEQVRRLLVLDGSGLLVGILTIGDIARDASEEFAGQALGEIIELRRPGKR